MKTLRFFGHACFMLQDDKTSILFDPFFTDNPFNIAAAKEVSADYILVSHAHFDHIGDTASIATRCGATVISTAEVCRLLDEKGCKTHAMHLGGKMPFPFGSVRVTPAFHGSGVAGGHACGFIVNFGGTNVYFAGDTSLFGDMALLGKLEKIDYALLPIGSNFTMGPDDAAIAAEMLQAANIVPMHYNTWPPIEQDPEAYKKLVEAKSAAKVHIMPPGDILELV